MSGRRHAGFTLVELMVACAILSLIMTGVIGFFSSVSRVTRQEAAAGVLESNLRLAAERLGSNLRRARYATPRTLLASWIPWVSGFNENPSIQQGTGGAPDTLTVAACTATPVATLRASLPASPDGASNTVTLSSAVSGKSIGELLNTSNRRLIRFGDGSAADEGFAQVTAIVGNSITFDTNLGASGSQGLLRRSYAAGTPVCRVDVTSYTLDSSTQTLKINEHQGAGAQPAIDGLSDLQISASDDVYRLVFTARSERPDPLTRVYVTREIATRISLRNP